MNFRQHIRDLFLRALLFAGLSVAVLVLAPVANGQTDIYKLNNTNDLTTTGSWELTGGSSPTAVNASDLGIINSTVTGANTFTFSSTLTLGGLQITNPGGSIILQPTTAETFNLGNASFSTTLPFAGIDMSTVTNSSLSLTLGTNVNTVLTASQNWYVGNGTSTPTLTVSGTLALGTNELYLVGSGNYNVAGAISGSGPLLIDSTGTTTLSGTNTNSGGVTLGNGTLDLTNASALGTGTFGIDTANLTGATYLTTGGATLTLSTNNQIQLDGNLNLIGSSSLNLGTGAMILAGNETANITTGSTLTIGGTIVDGGTTANSTGSGLTELGGGTLVLSGVNTFTGNLNLTAGTLSLTNNSALQNAILNYTGGTLTLTAGAQLALGGVAGNQNIALGTGNVDITTVYGHNASYSGNLTGGNTTSTVTINGAAIQAFSGFSNYTGNTTLNSGTLAINANGNATAGPIGSGYLVITGGSLDNTSGSNVTLASNNKIDLNGSFTYAGTGNLNLGTGAVTLGETSTTVTVSANTLTVGGIISGTGDGISKTGAFGTLVLTGANTYTGNTSVNAGTLILTGTNTPDAGNYDVNANSQLTLNGTNTFTTGNVYLASGGTLDLNSNSALGTSGGNLVINGGTLDNTSGANVTLSNNLPQFWNGSFTYAGSLGNNSNSSLNLGTGAVAMDASQTLTVDNATLTVGGIISGAGFSLTQAGNGTLVLNGTNTYSGGTIINSGTVVLAGANTGAGNTTVNSGAQLNINNAAALGTGTLILNGNLSVGGAQNPATLDNTSGAAITTSTHNNATQVNGTVNFVGSQGANSALTLGTGTVTLESNSTFNVEASTLTLGGVVSGTGYGLTLNGAGTLVVAGVNTYTGFTDINGGTLLVDNASGTISGASTSSNTNLVIADGGTLEFAGQTAGVTVAQGLTLGNFTATISNNGGANAVNFSNTTAINFNPSGTSNAAGGNASYVDASVSDTLILTGNSTADNTFSPDINNNGAVTSPTNVTINGSEWKLNGLNTYSGLTTLNAGTLNLVQAGNTTASSLGLSTLVINGGSLDNTSGAAVTIGTNNAVDLNSSFTFVGSNALSLGTGAVTLGSSAATITTTASTLTLGGVISDNGLGYSLTKAGAGTLDLTGVNTFSGNMNVSAGTLIVGSNNTLENAILNYTAGTVTFSNTTAVTLGGLAGTLAIANKAITLDMSRNSTASTSGIISGTSSLTISGSGTETLSGVESYSGGTNVNGGTLVLSAANTITGTTTLAGGTLDLNNAAALGTSTLTITGGNLNNTSGAAITTSTNNNAQNWNGNFTFAGTAAANALYLGTGTVTMNASRTLTISGSTVTEAGIIAGTGFGLTLNGTGTLDLDPAAAKASTYTGATTVNGGTFEIDFTKAAAATTNLVSSSSALALGGGTLEVLGFGTADTNSQTFASTTINSGASTITPNDNGGTSTTVALKAITRNAGGTLNLTSAATTANIVTTTSTTDVEDDVFTSGVGTGIAYLTVAGTSWGNISGSDIIALPAADYTAATATNWSTATENLNVTASETLSSAEGSINSLEFQGTTASTVTLEAGTLTIDTGGLLVSSNVTVADTITGGNIAGSKTANGELVVIQNGSANFTIGSNIINETGNTTGLTKSGTGQLILLGTNTYGGTTTLNQGTLALNSVSNTTASAIGTGGLVINGGSLDNLNANATLATNNALTLNNSFNFVGSNSLNVGTGAVTLGQNVTITTAANTLTVGGNITGSSLGITKAGAGELVLSGAGSSYSGQTILSAGTLAINNGGNTTNSALGTSTLVINGGTLDNTSGGAVSLLTNNAQQWNSNFTFAGSNALNLGTGAVALGQNDTLTVTASTLTVGGVISGGYSLTKNGTGDLVLSGASTYTGGTVINAGTLEASGNSSLGAGGIYNTVTVTNGTLQLDSNFDSNNSGSSLSSMLSLNGTGAGAGNLGALVAGGNATWAGNVTLTGNATISAGSTANTTLILGNSAATAWEPGWSNISLGANTLTFTGGQNTNITIDYASILGTGGINVNMTSNTTNSANNGVVYDNGWGNGYTGTTTVTNGTLIIDTQVNTVALGTGNGNLTAINGPLVIGTGVNSANSAIVQIGDSDSPSNPFSTSTNVSINSDGELFLSHGTATTLDNLTMTNGGYINTHDTAGSGYDATLNVLGTTTVNGNGTSTALISGSDGTTGGLNLSNSLGNATNVFNVTDSAGNASISDLTINDRVTGGSLYKTGNGTMTLTNGNNSYTGTTEIAQGTLAITASSVGTNSPLGATTNGTLVDSGGQLQLQNGITISGESLTINGNGTNGSNGALQNQSGNSVWNGSILVGANNATINTAGGNLTLQGTINTPSGSPTLTLTGNNNSTTISGSIGGTLNLNITNGPSNATNTVIMNGTQANTYTGNTTINANATLVLNATSVNSTIGGGTSTGTITINQGGTLLSDATAQLNKNVTMDLNGGTWQTATTTGLTENIGALTLSMSSNITLGSNTSVDNDITFANSSSTAWAPGANLYINGWNGVFATNITGSDANNGGGGTDQISFSSNTGLDGTSFTGQLGDIIFVNPEWNGVQYTGDYNAVIESDGEVVPFMPTPEPGTVAAGAGLAALALVREWRKRKSRKNLVPAVN